MIPYGRVEEYFRDQAQIPLSDGTLFNFNKEAFERLESFESIAKEKLRGAHLLPSDETDINVNGKRVGFMGGLKRQVDSFYSPQKPRQGSY